MCPGRKGATSVAQKTKVTKKRFLVTFFVHVVSVVGLSPAIFGGYYRDVSLEIGIQRMTRGRSGSICLTYHQKVWDLSHQSAVLAVSGRDHLPYIVCDGYGSELCTDIFVAAVVESAEAAVIFYLTEDRLRLYRSATAMV